jgi:hypothetical protein
MKYYDDFKPTVHTFVERIGEPDEFDAAIGRIALGFSLLEDTARNIILLLSSSNSKAGQIVVSELSFAQKLNVISTLGYQRISELAKEENSQESEELKVQFAEVLYICRRSEELRNTYLHSSYAGNLRAKASNKSKNGFKIHLESVNSSLLLDVADFIVSSAMILESIPAEFDMADSISGHSGMISYSKDDKIVATFKFGETK